MSIKINYNAKTIASMAGGQKTTLACKGKLMLSNVVIDASNVPTYITVASVEELNNTTAPDGTLAIIEG